ncbi:MAG: peptidoglycan-associated lipoprotein Pal [Magnetococcales bacterium]|nr:peptidoglycan-associated lipoprotein Pal [Magnetococcales bacterium]
MKRTGIVTTLLFSLAVLSACSSPQSGGPEAGAGGAGGKGGAGSGAAGMNRSGADGSSLAGGGAGGANAEPEHRVHFAFDSSAVTGEAQGVLAANARWIKAKGSSEVVVEGHCDERGTREYNLALGQKRADAAKEVLVSQGVDASKIKTVSFGKERALVEGHDEFAWSKNRRAELRIR